MAKLLEYSGNDACFINPYNFVNVDFEKEPERNEAQAAPGNHTGVLHCKLVTKTPISIPDMSKVPNKQGHKNLYFLRDESGVPMIPGSSLRGPVRSMFETLTNSCLSSVDETQSITFRTKDAYSPALLFVDDENNYHLYDAKRYIFQVKGGSYAPYSVEQSLFFVEEAQLKGYSYGQKVYILPLEDRGREKTFRTSRGFPTKSVFIREMRNERFDHSKEGFICIGEPFGKKKHFESVFVPGEEINLSGNQEGQDSLKKAVRDLKTIIDCYNDEKLNANAKGKSFYSGRNYKSLENGKYYPVWYEKIPQDGPIKHIHLSVANLGRAAYNKSMGDMVKDHKACVDRSAACPACRLFGMANGDGIGARVRFSDAVSDQPMPKKELVTLKELSGPKISYIPFYLRKSDGGSFGRDVSYDNEAYTIRGRKFYWHNTATDAWRDLKNEKTDRNTSAELVDKGTTFDFDVYYDRLTEDELKALVWTLTLGENNPVGKKCYKIGHGKPIGLGSVKIGVSSYEERQFNGEEYKIVCGAFQDNGPGGLISDKDTIDQVSIITDLDACNFAVEYPGVVDNLGKKYTDGSKNNNHASHQWFTSNFTLGNPPERVLPDIRTINDGNTALRWRTDKPANTENTERKTGKKIVTVSKIMDDQFSLGKFVAFCKEEKGIIKNIPTDVKINDKIEIEIVERNGKTISFFKSKAN